MNIHTLTQAAVLTLTILCVAPATAQTHAVYQDGNVRISLITDGVARLEYSPTGTFEDRPSFIAVKRTYPAVDFKKKENAKRVEISTHRMVVTYLKGTGRFTADNLTITSSKRKDALPFSWKPGQPDTQNLKGTYRTLDGYDGNLFDGKTPQPLEDGLLSRSGWTLIDDSQGYVFDDSEWPWVAHRTEEGQTQDWYFMAYGHDYKQALKDFTVFSGKVPLPPRYAFGYWWSRYWCYTDNELRELVGNFRNHSIPLDVLVVDMDWHYTEEGKGGWTGYTWNRRLFPDPDKFVKWVRDNDLNITFNLHPADGVKSYETHYDDLARWMGMDPANKQPIAWAASNKRFMQGWYDKILRPMERMGVSFWWLDWQQGLNDKEFPRLGNTWWINYTTFTDMERNHNTRPMLYHRWGGLGNHRYQIGFSGDSKITWRSLDYQPYFNTTASNVLYGYWSHDIGGHMDADHIDPELYIRWMQFGALSPILRTHSTKNTALDKEPWMFGNDHFNILRNIILQRYTLAPYIYTMARRAYEDGLSLCRPLYYEHPDKQEAYDHRNSYFFGDQMLVCPITRPMTDGVAEVEVWLPEGNDWYEVSSGTLLKGGQTVKRRFHLDEYPLYVKAGSVIPEYGTVKNLRDNGEDITVTVYPGGNGTFSLYEDNGNDKHYATEFARTPLTATHEGNSLTVTIGQREGSYQDMPANRQYYVKVVAQTVPRQVTADGVEVPFEYDGNTLLLTVKVPQTDCAAEKTIRITYPQEAMELTDGLIGSMRRIYQNNYRLKRNNAGIVFGEELGTLESTGRAISYHPEQIGEHISRFRRNLEQLPEILKVNGIGEKEAAEYLRLTF